MPKAGATLRPFAFWRDIRDVLFRTASEVLKESGGTQRPEIAISLFEPFVLAQ